MKNRTADYQELEFMVQSELNQQKSFSFTSGLSRIWHWIVESISVLNEPKLYTRNDKSGKPYWEIHDPFLGRRIFFDSETEVRAWLDSRYYQ